MANVDWDSSDFDVKMRAFTSAVPNNVKKGILDVATEILRLSQLEVPHDTGQLQNSGHLSPNSPADEIIVGYNKVYAAYQHEGMRADGSHVVTHWQDGRKKKYLEDPIRNNLGTFKKYFQNIFNQN